jgi:crotonobetainyl-CoA:carnitine CoA-transferase CaiB-like acyl-CoA transferase
VSGPLAGVRVLDLSRVLAGPFLTQMLAALGADVVKVEPPDGDPTRALGAPEVDGASYYFHGANAGKRSLCLDLRTEAGRAIALQLAKRADALVENFRPGVLERLGLPVEALRAANPRLVVLSISAAGADAPTEERERPSFDLCVQARGGTMSVNGRPGGGPTRLGIPMGDLAGSFYGAVALLAALLGRERGRQGTWVDLSLLDAQVALLGTYLPHAALTGKSPAPQGSGHLSAAPYDAYEAADGWLVIAVFTDRFWRPFLEAMGRVELGSDPRFAGAEARASHRAEIDGWLRPLLRTRPREEWLRRLREAGVPAEPVASVLEAMSDPAVVARGAVVSKPGTIPSVAFPARWDGAVEPVGSAPAALGRDRDGVLASWLGLDRAAIDAAAREGAFG